MKFSFASIILALFLTACQPTDTSISFTADIESLDREEATIKGMGYEKKLTVVDGKIQDTLQIPVEGLYSFRSGYHGTDLYLEPGKDISFTANTNDFTKSLKSEGTNAEIFKYYKQRDAINKRLLPRSTYQSDVPSFTSKMKMAKDSFSFLLDNYENLNSKFVALAKKSDKYEIANKFLVYKTYFSKTPNELPEAFQDALKGINMHDEAEYLSNRAYQNLVSTNFNAQSSKDTTSSYEEIFMKNISSLPAGNIKNNLLYNDMRYLMGPNENLDKFFEFFKKHSTNPAHLTKMEESYTDLLTLAKGEESPSFDYENYKGGNTTLDDLQGKYVYIDVWATWCGPCKAEIPHLKEKEQKYHDSNIEFVSISIDEVKDHEKWKKMIVDKELGGTQLFADNAWQSKFIQDYKIKGIPRFILIDPEGNIVSADAPRPSDKKLEKTLKELSI